MPVSARRLAKAGKRWLHLAHRWLGIVTGLLFATWLTSGLVMMYVAFPTLTEPERRAALPPLVWDRVAIPPEAVLAGEARFPRDLRLAMLDAEPVYRITGWDGGRRTVSAADGRAVAAVTPDCALGIAGHDPRAVRPQVLDTVARDQWSVVARYDPLRPFHRVALGDADGTELYVSQVTGAVALDTTRHERIWNWFGAVPHWIYLTPLRAQAALWRDVVLWVSGLCILGAATGFILGLMRLRPRRRYPSGAATPYRSLAKWHHLGGVVGGLALLSFIVSGWLSVNPNQWFSSRTPTQAMLERYAAAPGPRTGLDLAAVRAASCADAAEVRFTWLDGGPLAAITCRDGSARVCCTEGILPVARLAQAARRLLPNATLLAADLLREEDAYWYSHHQDRPLPVLRAIFDDPAATWFHIDPRTGEILDRLDRSGRINRWAFNLLHTFDLGLLVRHRPAWDAFVILLLAAGSVIAGSGVVIGWRRLRRPRPAPASG
ncbi:PepSY domain-containing protein [uncultured Methylobacterium sp.]|uniref:PepSY domain-containing protein n=1 Tax=uncultured Methylobacterium sp. TaxID=157278 RepID=UPI0035CBB18E